jgi:HPt (histidine-containing phosphotransfer) domain-containing protein
VQGDIQRLVLDQEQFGQITDGDVELGRELLAQLVDHTDSQLAKLATAVAQGDITQCMRIAHSSKGACANVGAVAISATFRDVEAAARDGYTAGMSDSLLVLQSELERLRAAAEKI